MLTLEVLIGLVVVLGLALLVIAVRRRMLSRGYGAIELSIRLKPRAHGRGWVLGVGRFAGDDLHWFRVFSLSPRPRRTLSRRDLAVRSRRPPEGAEGLALLEGAEVVELTSSSGRVEIALDASAMTGLLAWLEAQPPGATLPG